MEPLPDHSKNSATLAPGCAKLYRSQAVPLSQFLLNESATGKLQERRLRKRMLDHKLGIPYINVNQQKFLLQKITSPKTAIYTFGLPEAASLPPTPSAILPPEPPASLSF